MKDKMIWIIIALFVLIVLGVILILTSIPKKIESIKSMHFGYSNGYSINSYTYYDLQKKDDGYYVNIKPYGIDEEEAVDIKLTNKQVKAVLNVLNKYEVSKWDGFHKSDRNVLDGDSFSFSLYTEDGKSISASGYMSWPKNYGEVEKELTNIFDALYPYKDKKVYE